MTDAGSLGEFELMVLLAVLQVGEGAYAVNIRKEIERRTDRDVSRGAVYVTLDRLVKKGYVRTWMGEPTPARGGKAKRFYAVEDAGLAAIRESERALRAMRKGLDPLLGEA